MRYRWAASPPATFSLCQGKPGFSCLSRRADTEVVSLVAWREAHMGAGGGGGAAGIATNLFAVFLMRPTGSSEELRTDAREVQYLCARASSADICVLSAHGWADSVAGCRLQLRIS